jgi:hypothetical protein
MQTSSLKPSRKDLPMVRKFGGKSSQFKKGKGKKPYDKRPNDHPRKKLLRLNVPQRKRSVPSVYIVRIEDS